MVKQTNESLKKRNYSKEIGNIQYFNTKMFDKILNAKDEEELEDIGKDIKKHAKRIKPSDQSDQSYLELVIKDLFDVIEKRRKVLETQ